jgi:putative effector of murein hydrolase
LAQAARVLQQLLHPLTETLAVRLYLTLPFLQELQDVLLLQAVVAVVLSHLLLLEMVALEAVVLVVAEIIRAVLAH